MCPRSEEISRSTVPDSVNDDISGELQWDSQTQSGSGLPRWGGGCDRCGLWYFRGRRASPQSTFRSGADGCADFAGDVAAGVASPAVLVLGWFVGV